MMKTNLKKHIYFLSGLLCDEAIWNAQLQSLPSSFIPHIFSFPDFNSITDMAEYVLPYLQEGSIIVGHSMGARVAIELYRLSSHNISAIALLDFGIHEKKIGETEKRLNLLNAVDKYGMSYLIEHWLKTMVYEKNINNDQLFEPMQKMVLKQSAKSFKNQIYALLNRPQAENIFSSIQVPIYIGVGRQDQWSTLEQHQKICELNSLAKLHTYECSGHMSPVEAAHQVNISLIKWLNTL